MPGYLTIGHNYETVNCTSGSYRFERYNICATNWQKRSAPVQDILVSSPKISNGGVWLVLLIPPSYLLVYHQSCFQCNLQHMILIFLERISIWSSQGISVFYPVWWSFRSFPIFCVDVRKNSIENVGINMQHLQVVNVPGYGSLFSVNNVFRNEPIIFVSLVAHLL